MEDIVFNAMINFQFFCNNILKQKNMDKLVPKGMLRSDWNASKEVLLNEEIESVNRYLDEQAALRLQSFTASANKQDIEKRFADIIIKTIDSYKTKIKDYYMY
jgi:hypothetical protein